jgi:hypothetical protein
LSSKKTYGASEASLIWTLEQKIEHAIARDNALLESSQLRDELLNADNRFCHGASSLRS